MTAETFSRIISREVHVNISPRPFGGCRVIARLLLGERSKICGLASRVGCPAFCDYCAPFARAFGGRRLREVVFIRDDILRDFAIFPRCEADLVLEEARKMTGS